jgi:hypothetical protein
MEYVFYSRQVLVNCRLDWVRDPREHKTSRPNPSVVRPLLTKLLHIVEKNSHSFDGFSLCSLSDHILERRSQFSERCKQFVGMDNVAFAVAFIGVNDPTPTISVRYTFDVKSNSRLSTGFSRIQQR